MADKVKLSIEAEPELRRRVKLTATSRDHAIRQWIVAVIRHELESEGDGIMPESGAKPRDSKHPSRPRRGRLVSNAVIEDRRQRMMVRLDTGALLELYIKGEGREPAAEAVASGERLATSIAAYEEARAGRART